MKPLELKTAVASSLSVDDQGEISGLAWPHGTRCNGGDFITKGAFNIGVFGETPMLYEHDSKQIVGLWNEIRETDEGLHVKGKIFNDDRSRAVRALVRSGQVGGLSIGFHARSQTRHGPKSRTITALDLAEVSVTRTPAHRGARIVSAKSTVCEIELAAAFDRAIAALRNT